MHGRPTIKKPLLLFILLYLRLETLDAAMHIVEICNEKECKTKCITDDSNNIGGYCGFDGFDPCQCYGPFDVLPISKTIEPNEDEFEIEILDPEFKKIDGESEESEMETMEIPIPPESNEDEFEIETLDPEVKKIDGESEESEMETMEIPPANRPKCTKPTGNVRRIPANRPESTQPEGSVRRTPEHQPFPAYPSLQQPFFQILNGMNNWIFQGYRYVPMQYQRPWQPFTNKGHHPGKFNIPVPRLRTF